MKVEEEEGAIDSEGKERHQVVSAFTRTRHLLHLSQCFYLFSGCMHGCCYHECISLEEDSLGKTLRLDHEILPRWVFDMLGEP
jgi:hypothetical protein